MLMGGEEQDVDAEAMVKVGREIRWTFNRVRRNSERPTRKKEKTENTKSKRYTAVYWRARMMLFNFDPSSGRADREKIRKWLLNFVRIFREG